MHLNTPGSGGGGLQNGNLLCVVCIFGSNWFFNFA